MLLENEVSGANEPGDLLIIKKGPSSGGREMLAYDKATKRLFITGAPCFDSDAVRVVGEVIEERFNG
ncbi:hypothetical protein D3C71_2143120 [compost metagenome]